MDPAVFKTDQIIGIYPEQLREEDAWKIGHAAARYLRSLLRGYERGQANMHSLCVGRDMRPHSEVLAAALIEGITAAGANVLDLGQIDTPQLYFAVNHLGTCGGVQVTGSGYPPQWAGFKIVGLAAKTVSDDTGLKDIKHISTALLHTKARSTGRVEKADLSEDYRNHVLKFMWPGRKRLKVAVDALGGVAQLVVPLVFKALPVEIVPLHFESTDLPQAGPDPLLEKNLSAVVEAVKEHGCNFGVVFDGDADRVVFIDEQGRLVRGDWVTSLFACELLADNPGSVVVYDLRSSRVVVEEILRCGGIPRRERLAPSRMKKAMRDSHAIFGGGPADRFYFRDNFCSDSGLIALVHMINLLNKTDGSLGQQVEPLQRYHSSDVVCLPAAEPAEALNRLARCHSDAHVDRFGGLTVAYDDWWFCCWQDRIESRLCLTVEAKTEDLLHQKLPQLRRQLAAAVQCEQAAETSSVMLQ